MHGLQVSQLLSARRRTLAGLISMYEANFARLMRLAPELETMQGTSVSRVSGALDLYLSVVERSPYTTTVVLTYRFEDGGSDSAGDRVYEPQARIRVYHDVRAVELIGHARRAPARRRAPRRAGERIHVRLPELERKWELNRFLQKWLGFCLRQGHLFLRCTTTAVELSEPWRTTGDGERMQSARGPLRTGRFALPSRPSPRSG